MARTTALRSPAGGTVGIKSSSSGCTMVRNHFRAITTPFDVAAGNDVGSTGTAATATSPWANIVN